MLGRPVPLKHLSLAMLDCDAPIASDLLASMRVIHLIENRHHQILGEFPGKRYQSLYQKLENRLKKVLHHIDEPITTDAPSGPVSLQALQQAEQEIYDLWKQLSAHEEQIRITHEKSQHHKQLANSLSRFENLNIDLSWLSSDSPFLKFFIGTIPHNELEQLQRALSLANTVVDPFHKSAAHHYIFVATEKSHQQDIEEILKAASFHELTIPDELRSRPQQLREELQQQLSSNQQLTDHYQDAIQDLITTHQPLISKALTLLRGASPFATIASCLSGRGQLVILEGWVAASRIEEIDQKLQSRLQHPYLLTFGTPSAGEMSTVPSLQQHPRLLDPFKKLVNQFGVPRYGEVDPTPLFALSYTLMFGMMFGDVGHGAFIILAGFLFRKKVSGLFTFASFAGGSSILFGFLYGSLFGFEHLIPPLWMSPMSDPTQMLLIALIWGIGFLTITHLLSIANLLAIDQRAAALWSGRGVSGLLFLFGGVFAAYRYMVDQQFALLELSSIFLPLGLILHYRWDTIEGGLNEKILITLIEGVAKIINTLSATLSFLRVAAFSLNHVALAAAVFTLAEMMDPLGHTITFILGNLFIIVLEGGIVAIQCLRLEYYEGFSRFFSGKGERFTPLKMETH